MATPNREIVDVPRGTTVAPRQAAAHPRQRRRTRVTGRDYVTHIARPDDAPCPGRALSSGRTLCGRLVRAVNVTDARDLSKLTPDNGGCASCCALQVKPAPRQRAAVHVAPPERVPCERCCDAGDDPAGCNPGYRHAPVYDRARADDYVRIDGRLWLPCKPCEGSGLLFFCAECSDYVAGELAYDVLGDRVCREHVGVAVANAVSP